MKNFIESKKIILKNYLKEKNLYHIYAKISHFFFGYPADYVIIDEKKIVLFLIPKNANTSLRNSFHKAIYEKPPKERYGWYSRSKRNPDKKNYKKIAVVRNPYDRLSSAYENKIKSYGNDKVIGSHKEIYKDMPFKELVKIISKTPDKNLNRHFKSQTFFLINKKGKIIPDYIIRFENLEQDYKKVMKKIGIKNPPRLHQKNKSKRKKDRREYYDEETKQLIYERYKKDFELFNYKF